DARFGKPLVGDPRYAIPGGAISLAASQERPPPVIDDMLSERLERPAIIGNRVVREVSDRDLPQPFPLFGYRLMSTLPQLLLDLLEFRPHAVASGLPVDQELTLTRFSADEGKA